MPTEQQDPAPPKSPWAEITEPIGCLFWIFIFWLVFLGGCNLLITRLTTHGQ